MEEKKYNVPDWLKNSGFAEGGNLPDWLIRFGVVRDKDVYLPIWICLFGLALFIAAIACVYLSVTNSIYFLIGCILCVILGIAAILCWKNQWVELINDREFVYSTMFGKQTKYQFDQIKRVRGNIDSMTLIMENGKVHMESGVIVSDRFQKKLNRYI